MANTSNLSNEKNEGTIFYRRRIGDWFRRYIIELVFVTLVLAFVIGTTVITAKARKVFREAKDIRTALKFVGTQYYGTSSSIFDPSKNDGLIEGAAEEIADVSTHNGHVTLYAWNEKENEPLKFEYRKGSYTVVYTDDSYKETSKESGHANQMMGHWEVMYSFRILDYESE